MGFYIGVAPLGAPGAVLDVGSQLLVGMAWTCAVTALSATFHAPVMDAAGWWKLVVLSVFLSATFLIKLALWCLAKHALPTEVWITRALFPVQFAEEWLAALMFLGVQPLTPTFFCMLATVCVLEVIRDAAVPGLELRLRITALAKRWSMRPPDEEDEILYARLLEDEILYARQTMGAEVVSSGLLLLLVAVETWVGIQR